MHLATTDETTHKSNQTQVSNHPLDNIKAVIKEPLEKVHKVYSDRLRSSVALLQEVNDYVSGNNGKELRTILVLLSAGAATGSGQSITESTIKCAAAMEMLHNASLMHDDVVDEASERRGNPSVRQRWNNKLAVLCGDYYLAQVMRLLKEIDDKQAFDTVNRTVTEMSEGEVLQQQYIAEGRIDDKTYYEILRRKTASLMQACCELGDTRMKDFGAHYGMVFQLWDDLNDYAEDATLPKPSQEELLAKKREQIAEAKKELAPLPPSKYKDAITELIEILN
jgi:octaprenyl-diphosphate synthase